MSTQRDKPPPLTAHDDRYDAERAAARARQVLRSTAPGTAMAAILRLDLDSGQLEQTRRLVVGGVEEFTGLRLGELQALTAVAEGADHHRTVARLTGQADAAAAATVGGLVRRGLLAQHHHPAEPDTRARPTLLHLTARGQALLGQSEAIRIRLLDTVAQSLSETELEQVRAAAAALRPSTGPRRQIGGAPAAP